MKSNSMKTNPIWEFIKRVFSSFVGAAIAFTVVIFLTIIIFTASFAEEPLEVKPKSILYLKLNKEIVEKKDESPLDDLDLGLSLSKKKHSLITIKKAIKKAKNDPNIKVIYLQVQDVKAGYAMVEDIRLALKDFRESGKQVYAYGEVMSEKTYYLASVADKVFITPNGLLEFKGLSTEVLFFKGLFEKIGIEPKIFRVGKFKSAVEPYFRENMSDENRLQVKSFLEAIYKHNIEEIAKSRGITYPTLRIISDSLLVQNPADAVSFNLIDDTLYLDQVKDLLYEVTELDKEEELRAVSFTEYARSNELEKLEEELSEKDKIAVIVAEGTIMSGKSDDNTMGSATINKALRKARKDKSIKGVVLRVNSPGGSALASDVMWREVELLREEKPIIASMSDVAASGGYYISMGCDTIVAQPNTITGSIGVFGLLFNSQKLLNEKVGITIDRVNTGAYSDLGSVTRPMLTKEEKIIQKGVDDIYKIFTHKAAIGRNMSVEALQEVASGRVWSGVEAQKNGLVDVLGGLDTAIKIAAEKAKISDYDIVYYPKKKSFLQELASEYEASSETKFLKKQLGKYYPYYEMLKRAEEGDKIQARMPYDLILE